MSGLARRQLPLLAALFTAVALVALNFDGAHKRVLPGYIYTTYFAAPQSDRNVAIESRPVTKSEIGWPFCFAEGYGPLSIWPKTNSNYKLSSLALLGDLVICLGLTGATYTGTLHLMRPHTATKGFRVKDLIAVTAAIALMVSAPGVLYPSELNVQIPCALVLTGSVLLSVSPILLRGGGTNNRA